MIRKSYLGIRNHGRQKNSVSMPTTGADNTADAKTEFARRGFDETVVIAVNRQTGSMSAGTGKLVKRKVQNTIIIKIWS